MKRFFLLFLLLMFLLSSCGISEIETTEMPSPTEDTEYVPDNDSFGIAFASNESANPYTSSNKINLELSGLICEPLFSVSESFAVTPVLCSDYTYSNKEYTFNIKKGVTFSDGQELRPSDVEYSLRSAKESGSYYATRLAIIESIRSSNSAGFVSVKLKYDNARLPALLDIPIVKEGTRDSLFPTGTGIYSPKGDFSALIAREDHHSGKTAPYSIISLYDVSSTDELVFEFDTHNISILTSDPTGTTHLTPSGSAVLTNVPTTRLHYLGFNTRNPILSDKNIRRAIARTIDRESAATSDFALMGNAAELPIHPKSSLYSEKYAEKLSYDANTPVSISEPLTILVNSENSGKSAVCKRIAETLTRLGAPTTVRALPFSEYAAALSHGDFTLYYAEVSIGADFDITRLLSGPLNYGGLYDSAMNAASFAYLSGDEGTESFLAAFCDTVPFAPILFKDTAMYTEKNFFEKAYPSSQNVYHAFCDWVIGE